MKWLGTVLSFLTGGWAAVLELVPLVLEYWREVVIALLVVWITLSGALHDRKVRKLTREIDAIHNECTERLMTLRRSNERCADNLAMCQSNGMALEVALQRQAAEIEEIRLEQTRRRRDAEQRVAAAERERRQSASYAALLHERITNEEQCADQVRVAVEGVWARVLEAEASGAVDIESVE